MERSAWQHYDQEFSGHWYDETGWIRRPHVQVLRNSKVVHDTAWPTEKRQDTRNEAVVVEAKKLHSAVPAAKKQDKDNDQAPRPC